MQHIGQIKIKKDDSSFCKSRTKVEDFLLNDTWETGITKEFKIQNLMFCIYSVGSISSALLDLQDKTVWGRSKHKLIFQKAAGKLTYTRPQRILRSIDHSSCVSSL